MKNPPSVHQFGDWREFVCGLSSAFMNISVTFPLNKLIFRQIVHDVGVTGAIQQLSSEGFRHLYRGVLPPMCQKSITLSLMFGLYEGCRKPMIEAKVPSFLANPAASIIAGSTEAILTPFERIQTLLQDRNYNNKFHNMKHAFLILGPQYGFKEYYRGLTPVLLRNGPSNALFFFMKDVAKGHVPEPNTWWGNSCKEFATGAVIGAFLSCVFYPCNVVKYHMQTRLGVRFQTLSEAFWDIYRERDFKFRKLYRGVQMNCTRAFISWGVINVAYEWSKKLIY